MARIFGAPVIEPQGNSAAKIWRMREAGQQLCPDVG